MKFLIISDIHFHLWEYGDTEKRLNETFKALDDALTIGRDESVEAVLFCGDMFHTHGYVKTVLIEKLFRTLTRHDWNKLAVFLPGNHDMVYKNNPEAHSIAWLQEFGNVPKTGTFYHSDNLPVIGALPYTEHEDEIKSFFDDASDKGPCILTMHQGIRGVEINSKGFTLNEGISPEDVPDNVIQCFAGHYHSHKRVTPNLTIPGSLTQHNFGDAGERRGAWIFEYTDGECKFNFIENDATCFHKVKYGEPLDRDGYVSIEDVPVGEVEAVRKKLPAHAKIHTLRENQPVKSTSKAFDLNERFEEFVKYTEIPARLAKAGRDIIRCS